MAKKVQGYIKLQIPAGKATPAPPVGPALGQHGVNIVEFTKQYPAKHAAQRRACLTRQRVCGAESCKAGFLFGGKDALCV